MASNKRRSVAIDTLVDDILARHRQCCASPSQAKIESFFDHLLGLLFPEYTDDVYVDRSALLGQFAGLQATLEALLQVTLSPRKSSEQAVLFMDALGDIYRRLCLDADAMYHGDPAARSVDEVIRTYPGFYAIAAHRIAHQLLRQEIEIIPRSISELAHTRTGIDIHPGASVGEYFCIDHGTGIVVGETTVIGDHVKIYQGVTLGALSVDKADAKTKRHPTIGDHVVLYAGATILGGSTVVGDHSIVGGNVWLTRSVLPHSKVYYKTNIYDEASDTTDLLVIKS